MSAVPHCIQCGAEAGDNDPRDESGTASLCRHHTAGDETWAVVNRIANDFFMRGKVPPAVDLVIDSDGPWA